ncbi:anaphase-promoting complex subunit 10 [Fomitopsis serialis]|uniref:anaphase-promoting complex subunit 10 n=1 Tax=Fomitopsis serialis TaxID=139415 RepID=UPI002008B4B1|nr:anaphase-promoting complex subunit 10 [Neoantrodia serialis]KAH9925533.1 anaphase-promoting complex subunit 10 [Neoantrodia serialis]
MQAMPMPISLPSISGTGMAIGNLMGHMPADGTPIIHSSKKLPQLPWPDIGHLAKWSVSSYKFGFGPECLTDDDPDTFWHSDGPQPHFITIEFPRKVAVQVPYLKLSVYLSFPLDDSYTPATLAVRAGTGPADLQDVRILTLEKPDGWITFDVSAEPSEDADGCKPINAYVVQLIILANHMNGKDTHVRGLHILDLDTPANNEEPFSWVSPAFKMYECIR